MAFGNMTGLEAYAGALAAIPADYHQGSVILELDGEAAQAAGFDARASGAVFVGKTIAEKVFRLLADDSNTADKAETPLELLRAAYESPLAEVYPQVAAARARTAAGAEAPVQADRAGGFAASADAAGSVAGDAEVPAEAAGGARTADATGAGRPAQAKESGLGRRGRKCAGNAGLPPHQPAPLVPSPVFPGTNCEWDMERAFREAGGRTQLLVFRNRNRNDIQESIQELAAAIDASQIVALPGGFSAGDEPDGSGKFIANVFRTPLLSDALGDLLENRDGLMIGICNGFQALIKLGLVPYGAIRRAESGAPTLVFNTLGRHVSRMVRTEVVSTLSPWLALEKSGEIHTIPVSHGEGRIVMRAEEAESLFASGQISCCYADDANNPNGSDFAIEAISSPDGRILGKMGHSERQGPFVHINIPGNKKQRIFEAGVRYLS
jgi:phosphoribosylformylglycinamidine synthase